MYRCICFCLFALFLLPAAQVGRAAGRPANSDPRSSTEDRSEGVSKWPTRPQQANSSAEVWPAEASLLCEVPKVLDPIA